MVLWVQQKNPQVPLPGVRSASNTKIQCLGAPPLPPCSLLSSANTLRGSPSTRGHRHPQKPVCSAAEHSRAQETILSPEPCWLGPNSRHLVLLKRSCQGEGEATAGPAVPSYESHHWPQGQQLQAAGPGLILLVCPLGPGGGLCRRCRFSRCCCSRSSFFCR